MEITLTRKVFTFKSTIGELQLADSKFATIENVDRGLTQQTPIQEILRTKTLHPKDAQPEYSDVAIPYGRYPVAMTWSNRFGCLMPQILDVPGFDGIRFHIANYPKDIVGCVGVGRNAEGENFIAHSAYAFDVFKQAISNACAREKVSITIKKAE